MNRALNNEQIEDFWKNGYLTVENAVTANQLAQLKAEIFEWVEESKNYSKPYGQPTVDGRPRFDMGTEHTAERPALRRVNNPSDISAVYYEVMSDSRMVDMICDLIGSNIKFHHCKINLKCPGGHTIVHYHQDFAFTPHSNDDVVTALLMLDEVTEDNGCLMVVPGSHKGKMYSLYEDGNFVGRVSDKEEIKLATQQVPVLGNTGDVCLMHTRLAHG